jgi:dCTP deaminase
MGNRVTIIKDYIFEIVERVSRFYIHLDEIKNQFYFNEDNKVNDKLIFIHSYIDCLVKYIDIVKELDENLEKPENKDKDYIETLKSLIITLNHLHKSYLGHLPRPSEPVELKRFGRIIEKHIINLNKAFESDESYKTNVNPFSIYLSEEVGETTYLKDPILEFKEKILNEYIKDFNAENKSPIALINTELNISDSFHISIPRIDANNPCRWPTLMHEVAHKIYKNQYFNNLEIEIDFKNGLDSIQQKFVNSFSEKINLKSWLLECWCDLFACLVTGPVFWFSQFSAFIFQEKVDYNKIDEYYPKALFRLTLIKRILEHRFPSIFSKELNQLMKSAELILTTIDEKDNHGFANEDDIRQLFVYFRVYFLNYFFNLEGLGIQFGSSALNKDLKPLIKYTEEINTNTIIQLIESLIKGYPIPSKRNKDNPLIENPTFIQEILLAAWMYRNNDFKHEIFIKLYNKEKSSEEILVDIANSFQRFDKSILRSIQVSEWFDLLENEINIDKIEKIISNNNEAYIILESGILNDFEILSNIKDNSLKIIPIINIEKQLGSTSFDIRLGTSFQVYLQTKYGIVDFANPLMDEKINNSKMIDLDFLESITISPGQFILGHSMEYLKLPPKIAGQVEGRSSFARLGLQIHMTASFIDPGFEGVLTFEIYNAGPNPIKLYPGLRIAQLRFFKGNNPVIPYNRNLEAKYSGLLTHNDSMQFKDYEMLKIKNELIKISLNK